MTIMEMPVDFTFAGPEIEDLIYEGMARITIETVVQTFTTVTKGTFESVLELRSRRDNPLIKWVFENGGINRTWSELIVYMASKLDSNFSFHGTGLIYQFDEVADDWPDYWRYDLLRGRWPSQLECRTYKLHIKGDLATAESILV